VTGSSKPSSVSTKSAVLAAGGSKGNNHDRCLLFRSHSEPQKETDEGTLVQVRGGLISLCRVGCTEALTLARW
jgi:hypothetical protein